MALTAQFYSTARVMTPPSSDRGECEDIAGPVGDSYVPEGLYPSPAPSHSYQQSIFSSNISEVDQSDTSFDTDDGEHQAHSSSQYSTMDLDVSSNYMSGMHSFSNDSLIYPQPAWIPYNNGSPGSLLYHPIAPTYFNTHIPHPYADLMPLVPQSVANHVEYNPCLDTSITNAQCDTNEISTSRQLPSQHVKRSASCSSTYLGTQRAVTRVTKSARRPSFSTSKASVSSLHAYGIPIHIPDSTTVHAWRCSFPNCTSKAFFTRGCDLRKHYNRHSKHLFCRVEQCPQSEAACVALARQAVGGDGDVTSNLVVVGGFSSKKDRLRHEAKHNPDIRCEWISHNGEQCGRLFSRMDNMKDHVRRIHCKGLQQTSGRHSGGL